MELRDKEGVYYTGFPEEVGWYDCLIRKGNGEKVDARLLHRKCINQPGGHVWQNEMGNKIKSEYVEWTGYPTITQ